MTRKKTEMIRKVYDAQKMKPGKNDWALIVEKDLKHINFEENIEKFDKKV